MERTLTDGDVQTIALRIVQIMGAKLISTEHRPEPPTPVTQPQQVKVLEPKLAYSLKELSTELGISKVSLYRLEARGLLKSLPYLRTKVFSRAEVDKFLRGTEWQTPNT